MTQDTTQALNYCNASDEEEKLYNVGHPVDVVLMTVNAGRWWGLKTEAKVGFAVIGLLVVLAGTRGTKQLRLQ